jgi:hypothetical protein
MCQRCSVLSQRLFDLADAELKILDVMLRALLAAADSAQLVRIMLCGSSAMRMTLPEKG